MKKFVFCLAITATAIFPIFSCSNLRAQTLTPQLTDQDPPPDPIFLQQGLPAIPPSSPDAPTINDGVTIVTYSPDNEVIEDNDDGKATKLPGLAPDQIVDVTIQFGAQKAGELIQGAALDGGILSIPPSGLTADENGSVSFQFQAGHEPGLYQVALRDETHEMGVQFWVINYQAPAQNPPVDLPQP
jgi:hypothetical protein